MYYLHIMNAYKCIILAYKWHCDLQVGLVLGPVHILHCTQKMHWHWHINAAYLVYCILVHIYCIFLAYICIYMAYTCISHFAYICI